MSAAPCAVCQTPSDELVEDPASGHSVCPTCRNDGVAVVWCDTCETTHNIITAGDAGKEATS